MGLFGLFGKHKKKEEQIKTIQEAVIKPNTPETQFIKEITFPDGRKGFVFQRKTSRLVDRKQKNFWNN